MTKLEQAEADMACVRIACRELNNHLSVAASHGVLMKLNIYEDWRIGSSVPLVIIQPEGALYLQVDRVPVRA